MKIFKYKVQGPVNMPEGSDVLYFGEDPNGELCIWALVSENAPLVERYFFIVGTGQQIETMRNRRYIGTCRQGPFMWHLIEQTQFTASQESV